VNIRVAKQVTVRVRLVRVCCIIAASNLPAYKDSEKEFYQILSLTCRWLSIERLERVSFVPEIQREEMRSQTKNFDSVSF
jgi:hypothetical protein